MRHWALGPAKSAQDTNANHPLRDAEIEMPDWLAKRLADATPLVGVDGGFRMPADDADLTQLDAWPTHAGEFPLWPENRAVFNLFADCRTQWLHAGMDGARTGLNYKGVEFVVERHRFRWTDERWEEFRACEDCALFAWSQQRAADEAKKAK